LTKIKNKSTCAVNSRKRTQNDSENKLFIFLIITGIFLLTSYLWTWLIIQANIATGNAAAALLSLGFLWYGAPFLTIIGVVVIITAVVLRYSKRNN